MTNCDTDTISRQAAIDAIYALQKDGCIALLDCAVDEVKNLPSAPQRTGQWIDRNDNVATCSVCGKRWGLYRLLNFCPNCGARMEDE